jgi:hypothetical protein
VCSVFAADLGFPGAGLVCDAFDEFCLAEFLRQEVVSGP